MTDESLLIYYCCWFIVPGRLKVCLEWLCPSGVVPAGGVESILCSGDARMYPLKT